MREIKFRAWDKKTKKMRAVDSIAFHYEKANFDYESSRLPKVVNLWGHHLIEDKTIILHREIDEVILMQFTGLKDKNGKEIYEGDIITGTYLTGKLLTGRIWYDEQAAVFMVEDRYAWMWQEKEVIGNIYEHPSLLKDTQHE